MSGVCNPHRPPPTPVPRAPTALTSGPGVLGAPHRAHPASVAASSARGGGGAGVAARRPWWWWWWGCRPLPPALGERGNSLERRGVLGAEWPRGLATTRSLPRLPQPRLPARPAEACICTCPRLSLGTSRRRPRAGSDAAGRVGLRKRRLRRLATGGAPGTVRRAGRTATSASGPSLPSVASRPLRGSPPPRPALCAPPGRRGGGAVGVRPFRASARAPECASASAARSQARAPRHRGRAGAGGCPP